MAWNWRGEIVRIFGEPVSSEEEATGEEYQDTLKAQAILEVYLANYAAILADRKAIMNEQVRNLRSHSLGRAANGVNIQRTLLAAHEGRFDKKRRTKAALDAEEGESEQGPSFKDIVEEDDVEKLQQELSNARRNLQSVHSRIGKPLKAILIELNGELPLNQVRSMGWSPRTLHLRAR
jgi:E3 ubiquitin-protein ligase SHPRH